MYCLLIMKGADGKYFVNVSPEVDEEEKKHLEFNGDEIVATYPLEGSLHALGMIVSDSTQYASSFGNLFEDLMTQIVNDISTKG